MRPATSDRVLGAPVLWLRQIAAAMARMRRATRTATPSKVRPPCCSRSNCPLRVSFTDLISCRTDLSRPLPLRFFSHLNEGRSSSAPRMTRSFSNSLEAKPLSAMISSPGRSATRSSSTSNMAWSTSRSPSFGFASAHRIGIPVGVRPAGKTGRATRRRRFKEWTGARRRWPSSPCRSQWKTRSTNASRLPCRRSICCSTVRDSSMRPPGAAFFLPRTYNEQSRSAQM